METIKLELADANGLNALEARAKAIKGLVKIARGDIESGML